MMRVGLRIGGHVSSESAPSQVMMKEELKDNHLKNEILLIRECAFLKNHSSFN
jgi:hypothetical protein